MMDFDTNGFMRSSAIRNALAALGFMALIVVLSAAGDALYHGVFAPKGEGDVPNPATTDADAFYDGCNVAGINLHGELSTYGVQGSNDSLFGSSDAISSDTVMAYLDLAERAHRVKAIVLEVDSGGGSPVAGEEIADGLKHSKKSTVALIRELGASASYWAATGAQTIFAARDSDVGSIGVTSSFVDTAGSGSDFISLASGKFKDLGNPDKPLTEEEKDLIMRDVNKIYEHFMQAISDNRHIPLEKVRELADGSTVLGDTAKEQGLVDELGNLYDVEAFLEKKLGEKVNICWN